MNKSVLSFYMWAYDNTENVDYVLSVMRDHYPDSDLVISSDNGSDFTEISGKYKAVHYIHGDVSHGYPESKERYGWTASQAGLWLERLYEACKHITTEYVMLMEEDILVKERFKFPAFGIVMIPNIKNHISQCGMDWVKRRGGNTTYPYYSAGGGTIINRKKFIQSYENHIDSLMVEYEILYSESMKGGAIGWGWNDSLLAVLMYAGGASISTELPISETGDEYDSAPIIHKFKKYYKRNLSIDINHKNIFLSCSCTNPNNSSIYDGNIRLEQLLETIKSCDSVPDKINIISEGSALTQDQKDKLKDNCIVLTFEDIAEDVKNKQTGSLALWIKALERLNIKEDSNVFFLSGRYRLSQDFNINDFNDSYVFKKPWYSDSRGGWYGTQLFKISGSNIKEFYKVLQHAKRYINHYDIECSLYRSFKDLGIQPTELEYVNCIGENAPTGHINMH